MTWHSLRLIFRSAIILFHLQQRKENSQKKMKHENLWKLRKTLVNRFSRARGLLAFKLFLYLSIHYRVDSLMISLASLVFESNEWKNILICMKSFCESQEEKKIAQQSLAFSNKNISLILKISLNDKKNGRKIVSRFVCAKKSSSFM